MSAIEILFWISLSIVFYTYIGYGILLWVAVLIKEFFMGKQSLSLPDPLPRVTLFITAWNEEEIIDQKVSNTRSLDYPPELLDVVWVTDGSTDLTNERLSHYSEITVHFIAERQGKCAAMNRGIKLISTPITIFTDANTMLNKDAILEMVRPFSNPKCGCVAGEKRIKTNEYDNAASGGESFYWRYESFLKDLDSRLDSCTGAAGELFGIRTALFEEVSSDTLLDDFIISLRIKMRGYKVCYTSKAYALEGGSANIAAEQKRKVRIAAGGLQSIWRLRGLLNPLKHGLFSIQYISHRVLRWSITPLLFFLLLPINIILVINNPTLAYLSILCLQLALYTLAIVGSILQSKNIRLKLFFIPYYICFMNINVFKGVKYLCQQKGKGTWERAKRAS